MESGQCDDPDGKGIGRIQNAGLRAGETAARGAANHHPFPHLSATLATVRRAR